MNDLAAARAAQRAARDHGVNCRTDYRFCRECQRLDGEVVAAYARADTALDAARRKRVVGAGR